MSSPKGTGSLRRRPSWAGGRALPSGTRAVSHLHGLGVQLLLLLLCACAAAVMLAGAGLLEAGDMPGVFARELAAWLDNLDQGHRALVTCGALVVGVASAWGLFTRSRPKRSGVPERAVHVLSRDEKGLVVISARSVGSVATAAALRVPGVADAELRSIGPPEGPMRLRLDVEVLAGTPARETGEEVRRAVRETVETLLGTPVGAVDVQVEVGAPEKGMWLIE